MISKVVTEVLGPLGFKRRGLTWQLDGEETVCIVNFQKSNYDAKFFLNIGFLIRREQAPDKPKEHECDVRLRAGQLWPSETATMEEVLEHARPDRKSEESLRAFLLAKVAPFIQQAAGLDGLRRTLMDGALECGLIRKSVRETLGILN